MSQSLPTDEYCEVHKKSIFDKYFIKTLICFQCSNKKLKQRMCNINVISSLDLKCNKCQYYKELIK